jgi:hypothetical protein
MRKLDFPVGLDIVADIDDSDIQYLTFFLRECHPYLAQFSERDRRIFAD